MAQGHCPHCKTTAYIASDSAFAGMNWFRNHIEENEECAAAYEAAELAEENEAAA